MDKALITQTVGELSEREPLELAGQVANRAAVSHVVEEYLSRKARNTIRTQAAALDLFAEYLDAAADVGAGMRQFAAAVATWAGDAGSGRPDPAVWRGVTWGIVEGFVKWLLNEGYAVATVNNRLSTVKVYAKLAMKARVITADELQLIKAVSGYSGKEAKRIDERRPVERVGDKKEEHVSLAPVDAAALKDQDLETPQGHRGALLMCLLLDHGLRVSEVAGLQVTDFDLPAGELRFYRPKVDKVQTHRLTADTLQAAQAYFADGAPAIGRAILASRKGSELVSRPMSKRAITKRVRYLGQQFLGLEDLSAHDCRHFWATDAARNGTDPFRLQEAGGWSSLAMPRRYVEDAKVANEGVNLSRARPPADPALARPEYGRVWEIEKGLRQWLSRFHSGEELQMMEEMKRQKGGASQV